MFVVFNSALSFLGTNSYWNIGIMENWNIGFPKRNISNIIFMNKFRIIPNYPDFRDPIIPSLHCSTIPSTRECYPPASPVRRNLHLRESGTVNSDGGQAAAAYLGYSLLVISYLNHFLWLKIALPNNK